MLYIYPLTQKLHFYITNKIHCENKKQPTNQTNKKPKQV